MYAHVYMYFFFYMHALLSTHLFIFIAIMYICAELQRNLSHFLSLQQINIVWNITIQLEIREKYKFAVRMMYVNVAEVNSMIVENHY